MKPTIDLTEHQDFRKEDTTFKGFPWVKRPPLPFHRMRKMFPWTAEKPFGFGDHSSELVFTGDREVIAKKKMFQMRDEGVLCERCGVDLSNQPWNMSQFLCRPCDSMLEEDIFTRRDPLLNELVNE